MLCVCLFSMPNFRHACSEDPVLRADHTLESGWSWPARTSRTHTRTLRAAERMKRLLLHACFPAPAAAASATLLNLDIRTNWWIWRRFQSRSIMLDLAATTLFHSERSSHNNKWHIVQNISQSFRMIWQNAFRSIMLKTSSRSTPDTEHCWKTWMNQ